MSDAIQPAPALHGDRPAAASAQGLADRNELAAVAVERARMPMVVSDPRKPDSPIVLANAAFLKLTGYSAEEVIGQNCRFLQGPETSRSTVDKIRRALKDERELEIEILNYRKDGSAFWNLLNLSPVHDDNGRLLYVFASQIDMTELRKVQALEASERRLLKEVDHRANNALAVVSAIVRLSRTDDTERYAEAIQDRVQVLARAHTLLAERGWRDLALEDSIDEYLGRLDRSRVSLEGPEIMVPAVRVQPLALVLHELLDNAMNHGALSVPEGRLGVEWTGLGEAGGFQLRWREDGGPAPAPDPGRGFGELMIKSSIERQLQGRVEREWRAAGLAVRIEVPGESTLR